MALIKKRNIVKLVALLLVLTTMFSLLAIPASASGYASKRGTIYVDTGSRPWYSLLNPRVTVSNQDNCKVNIWVYNSKDIKVSHFTLNPYESFTISLKCNDWFYIYGNNLYSSRCASISVSAGRYVTSVHT